MSVPEAGNPHVIHPHMDVRLVDGVRYYLHRDNRASVTGMTDDDGDYTTTTYFGPFGEILDEWQNANHPDICWGDQPSLSRWRTKLESLASCSSIAGR